MKRKISDLSKPEIITTLDTLYTAASVLRGRQVAKLFLKDLLTPSERIMLGRRIIIARLLLAGESYKNIQKRMRVGKTTVSRVQHWLSDQIPGYEHTIKELEKEFFKRAEKRVYATNALYRLKKKYPLHYLLLPRPKIKSAPIYPSRKNK
ncbi:hypothetical protein A2419_02615 [Candidatus Adlerbacteria bacterium RIFOXYC1_FULL_48_26]|uniref:TrpR like protein, YerC/YecD n=1 Tax=Candidatus Adlerbacteria bacterium RIFOXYC1_FULL_48_26 TaxID=1797247 RepID=A0A1F4Y291_9BACT|nr:MAG: hypothetical protein A2419_02615 [Candidatus Adlerbacteria bacterium RIFOXYC1_FULL_48_26]OGC94605.1 MAG: hypothetical protein A2389_03400 [Candidatus Adlerbacteria bacterium RIFOXYB1_FULL_48_10]